MLVYSIDRKLVKKVSTDFASLVNEQLKRNWWKQFVANWKEACYADVHSTYITDATNWICSCPTYLRNELLICKHLVSGMQVPKYRELCRYTKPLFLCVQLTEDRLFPNLNGECNCSTVIGINHAIYPPALDFESSYEADSLSVTEVHNEILEWGKQHCMDISKDATQIQQLLSFRDTTLHQLQRYSIEVQNSYSARNTTRTRGGSLPGLLTKFELSNFSSTFCWIRYTSERTKIRHCSLSSKCTQKRDKNVHI